jgi:hypothetical protein
MLSPEAWLLANEAYLAAAVSWLFRLLELGPTDERTAAAAESVAQAAAIEPPPALMEVGDRFGLTPFERHLLLLCVAIELDSGLSYRCAEAQGDPARPFPTFSLAESYFDGATWVAISPERPLRYWHLIEIHQPGAQPLRSSALRADERVVAAAKGLRQVDDRIAMLASPLGDLLPPGRDLPSSQAAVAAAVVRQVRALATPTASSRRWPPLQLVGADTPSKEAIAAAVADTLGLWLYRLAVDVLPTHAAELETLARLWEREALLLPVALYMDVRDADPPPLLTRFLARTNGLVFLDTREACTDLGDGSNIFDVARPTLQEQKLVWTTALGPKVGDLPTDGLPSALVARFSFDAAAIYRLASRAQDAEELEARCRRSARLRMQGLAHRIQPRVRLEQVILPPESEDLLAQIVRQARHRVVVYDDWGFRVRMNRGLGISALFSGESGTGKTMAAEAIAHALGLDLYRIDLSAVVSKYIGETEKNLRRVFDAAEAGGAVLFFDEADALFGKRSEVKDSHDRYANIEISYLLQRMEEFDGLAILATNMKSAIDPAFMRRLRFVVDFPFPNAQDRRLIWQQAFPSRLARELSEDDWDRLARFQLTGGHIVIIALNAAFRAAGEGLETVQMHHILQAARAEYAKLERPINEGDFR